MTPDDPRFQAALARIDARHRQDPSGQALDHARAVAAWVDRLRPEASPALRLAARAAHLDRWRVPRASYPSGRAGYLRWRSDLAARHAAETAALLRESGWDEALVARVGAIVRKADLAGDPETQTFEDALCLTFMARQLAGFGERQPPAKLARILGKTWRKMSVAGREAALTLDLPEHLRDLLPR
ncbi:MAG: hypothetical protein CMQ43_13485 [Gammaproteobacteria bacterium]|nr:hypothetical protein [Gammaproteobacteria bacterium]